METLTLVGLSFAVFATAALSAVVGMGGGVTLLALMAVLLPPPVVIPLHGVVQLVSNGTRALVYLPHVHRKIFAFYIIPATLGVFAGAQLYVGSPLPWFRPAIGVFILLYLVTAIWKPSAVRMPIWGFGVLGAVTGTAASLVGATGPMLAPFFLRDDMTKEEVVATKASVQLVTHFAKVPAFFAMGFAYGAWALELLPLCGAAVLGTVAGKRLLSRIDAVLFRRLFMAALFAIALHLISEAFR